MNRFGKILVPIDFSPCSNKALGQALALAEKVKAQLLVLHVSLIYEEEKYMEEQPMDEHREVLTEPKPEIEARMREVIAAHGARDVKPVLVQIRDITAADAITACAEERQVDLIVVGTHGRRGFKRWLLGSVAEELVHRAPCPVMTLKEKWQGRDLDQMRNILVPIDFSLASRSAIRRARELAALLDAGLQVMHVIQPPPYPDIYTFSSTEDFYAEARLQSDKVMHDLLAEPGPEVRAVTHVTLGHPAREILLFAENNDSDLIMMAHLGISRVANRPLGSVTEHVVRRAECPVLTADMGDD